MFDTMQHARLSDIHFHHHEASGLKAIIAIHNTRRGPALGGCRTLVYDKEQKAIDDAINLARSMSYKAALAGLDQGGGKAVILLPDHDYDRTELFSAFGDFVESLSGRYITALDSGTQLTDLATVATRTSYVVGTGADGFDPSPATAKGVLSGISSAVRQQLGKDQLAGVRVAIQGVGHVGGYLAKSLAAAGAQLVISDIAADRASEVSRQTGAEIVGPDQIVGIDCDVFCPCGLGGIINSKSVKQLRCKVVAGAANNQLENPQIADQLKVRDILYVPDYLINAGGLICLSLARSGQSSETEKYVENIGKTVEQIIIRAREEGVTTHLIAERMAEELIYQ